MPTPSALLPWPVAASLPYPSAGSPPITSTMAVDSAPSTLAARITDGLELPRSPSPTIVRQPTLMSRMTANLAARLSDPGVASLSSWMSDPNRPSLEDRLEMGDRMSIDHPPPMDTLTPDDLNLAAVSERMASASPLILDPVAYDNPWRPQSERDDAEEESSAEEVAYKKTKRGRRLGQKIQGYRRRDEEREDQRRRNQCRR